MVFLKSFPYGKTAEIPGVAYLVVTSVGDASCDWLLFCRKDFQLVDAVMSF